MTLDEINRLVRCEGHEDNIDDTVTFQYDRAKFATAKAVLIVVDGEDAWIPYSQLIDWWPESREAQITSWIAGEKGLL